MTKRTVNGTAPAAFTLVEVLVVLVLISILSGMVMTAVQGVTTSARMARTRSILATVDSVIQEQYESYKYRPFPVVIPTAGGLTPSGNVLAYEIMPSEAARVRLIMTRDLQRMELPDRVSDLWSPNNRATAVQPVTIRAVADRVVELENPDGTTRLVLLRRESGGDLSQRTPTTVEWYNGTRLPNRFDTYLRRTRARRPDGSLRWTAEHQGAECLYLILATTFSSGVSAIEAIPASNVGDTDDDGVPEILDGWGRPLGFVRWPVGFADPEIDPSVPDEFDPFRSDFGFLLSNVTPPFTVRPLVISAGADGEFGTAFSPRRGNLIAEDREISEAALVGEEVNYAAQTWPVTLQAMGPEMGGRDPNRPYFFPDPFLRQFASNGGDYLLPGQGLLGDAANSWRADNITNFQLEATQ